MTTYNYNPYRDAQAPPYEYKIPSFKTDMTRINDTADMDWKTIISCIIDEYDDAWAELERM